MTPGRDRSSIGRASLIVGLAVAVIGIAIATWVLGPWGDEDQVELVEEMSELAAQAQPDDFPAIVDSGVRDVEARVPPVAATFEVIDAIPHDTSAFTQGFELVGERLFESTGLVGSSTVREVDPATGSVVRSQPVPGVFAEGLTAVDDELIQITWTEGIAYRYDVETFDVVETHTYDGQGWGICHDGSRLVMSDGTPSLTFRDTNSFAEIGTVDVTFNGAPVERVNELECVGTSVWANIWQTPLLIEINPATGEVQTVVDASSLRPESTLGQSGAVLNGIAHDAATDTFLLTGKLWPTMFRVEINR